MAPASLAKFSLYVWLAAMVIYGIVEITLAYGDRSSTASSGKSVVTLAVPQPTLMSSATRSITMARLVIEDQQTLTNEPLPLNIVLHGATGGEANDEATDALEKSVHSPALTLSCAAKRRRIWRLVRECSMTCHPEHERRIWWAEDRMNSRVECRPTAHASRSRSG